MLFNSYIFILLFLPLTLTGYFACNAKGRYAWGKLWLLAMSLWFYAWFNIHYLPVITGSILGNYLLYRLILGERGRPERKRRCLYLTAAGSAANLGVLFYYKYFDFFLENLNALFHADLALQHLVLPLGISFFTFQQVGFLVDTYREETGNYSFLDYALFVSFFPQLIAGPIVTYDEMITQFPDPSRKGFQAENASKGIYAFACGLAKKVLIADVFGRAVSWGFARIEELSALTLLLVIVSYMVQLYFDFSGYCDMARGTGFLFNITIPVNFNSPYRAVDLIDFWKRWHITLSRFLTKYVYIPLGGNRKGKRRADLNVFMVYLLSGIWHGAGWTFLCWGVLHGAVYILTKRFLPALEKLPAALTWLGTMVFFLFSLIFFRAESMGHALFILKGLVSGSYAPGSVPAGFLEQFQTPEFFYCLKLLHLTGLPQSAYILPLAYLAAAWLILLCCKNVNEKIERFRPTRLRALGVSVLLLWSVFSFSEVSAFLYFNF